MEAKKKTKLKNTKIDTFRHFFGSFYHAYPLKSPFFKKRLFPDWTFQNRRQNAHFDTLHRRPKKG